MKRQNLCKTYGQTLLRGTRNSIEIPKGCFYGTDEYGLWYTLDTKPTAYSYCGNNYRALTIYRFIDGEWEVGFEFGPRVDEICEWADSGNFWADKLEYCLHLKAVSRSIHRCVGSRHTKASGLKDASKNRMLVGIMG